jgi:2-methylcitrate dehydratase PrpD
MLAGRDIAAEDIESVEVRMGKGQVNCLVYERPQTRWEAEFSGQYGIAAAVLFGKMGVPELADEVVQSRNVQEFLPKVTLVGVDEYDERDPVFSPSESVRVQLRDGEVIESGPITTIPGHANDPLNSEQLWGKFRECTIKSHSESEARNLFEQLQKIDSLSSASALPTCESLFADN